jgi:hypothetical protein
MKQSEFTVLPLLEEYLLLIALQMLRITSTLRMAEMGAPGTPLLPAAH